jgi:glycosyltransferase involved in cell wall biosynthesis
VEENFSMKVLHVIPSVAPVRGGPSQAVVAMVNALRSNGVDAEIAATNDNGLNLLNVPTLQRINYPLTTKGDNVSVPTWFFPRFSPNFHAVREFAFSGELTKWLWQNIREYDLIHVHAIFSYTSTVAMAIARMQGVPYIVRPLGQLCEWSLKQSAAKKQIYLRLIERENLNKSQGLHLTSIQEQQEISSLGLSAPTFVLPHGLYIPEPIPDAKEQLRQHLNLPADEPIILFLSRLHPKKGLEHLIQALSKLTHHRWTFVLAGDGSPEYEAKIDSLLISSGISSRTKRPGFVAGEVKNLLLQGSDLFALTSYSENFGVAVLEAMAASLPVLVTDGVALASVIAEHQVGYITELDVCGISNTIEQYLSHPQAAKDMGNRARQLVLQKYTWNSIATNLNNIYKEIVSQNILKKSISC